MYKLSGARNLQMEARGGGGGVTGVGKTGWFWFGLYAASGSGSWMDPSNTRSILRLAHSLCSVGPGGAADGADLAGGAVRRQHPAVGQHMAGVGGGAACTGNGAGGVGDGDQGEDDLQGGGSGAGSEYSERCE